MANSDNLRKLIGQEYSFQQKATDIIESLEDLASAGTTAEETSFDNSGTGIVGDNVQDALVEIDTTIENVYEVVTTDFEFFIDPATGSDSNDGLSPGTAWQTWGQFVTWQSDKEFDPAVIQTVYLNPGNYTKVTLDRSSGYTTELVLDIVEFGAPNTAIFTTTSTFNFVGKVEVSISGTSSPVGFLFNKGANGFVEGFRLTSNNTIGFQATDGSSLSLGGTITSTETSRNTPFIRATQNSSININSDFVFTNGSSANSNVWYDINQYSSIVITSGSNITGTTTGGRANIFNNSILKILSGTPDLLGDTISNIDDSSVAEFGDYNNTTSGLTATTKQNAIDELTTGNLTQLPGAYADDTAAAGGGVAIGQLYYTATGEVRVRLT